MHLKNCLIQDSTAVRLSLAELLSALSCALDLTEGQPMGHCIRACRIALRIAKAIGLPQTEQDTLYLVMLLKDSGCASNAARMFALFGGDERAAKRDGKIYDWANSCESVKFAFQHALPGGRLRERLSVLQSLSKTPERVMDTLTIERCTEGADIARLLGLSESVASAIYCLDEHWDGRGAPHHLPGEQIPLLARIACLAQTMEVYAATFGVPRAYATARKRSGRWFDPELVHAARSFEEDLDFWTSVLSQSEESLLEEGSGLREQVTEASLDSVCEAFARIIDSKSSFTAAHSSRVAAYADKIALTMAAEDEQRMELRRASLLHDIGKLGVPNSILDKPGSLTDAEFEIVQRHPMYSSQILSRIPSFERITKIAAAHHEKLNGRGYFQGLVAADLTPQMRLLTVADIFDALTAERPYRRALAPEQALQILKADALSGQVDSDCVDALEVSLPQILQEGGFASETFAPLGIMKP